MIPYKKTSATELAILLQQEHSKEQTMKIVRFIGTDQVRFNQLISFCLGSDIILTQRASWVFRFCVEKHPGLMRKQIRLMLKNIQGSIHPAVRRNFIKSLEYISIPHSLEAKLISLCFDLINSKKEFVAIKVYALNYLTSCCVKYPDLIFELKSIIESQMEFKKPAFLSASRKFLKKFKLLVKAPRE